MQKDMKEKQGRLGAVVRDTAKLIMNNKMLAGKRRLESYLHLSEQSCPREGQAKEPQK